MKLHGTDKLWPTELKGFNLIKRVFLGFYRKATRIKIFGKDFWKNIRNQTSIVVANHITGADSIVLQVALRKRLFMLAARKWFSSRIVEFFMSFFCDIVPIAMAEGARTILGIKRSLQLLTTYRQSIGMFPSGHLEQGGDIGLIQPGASYLSVKTGTPIVPVYLKNLTLGPAPGSRPWVNAAWEGAFSVFGNIGNRKIEVYIGEPIYPERMDGKKMRDEISRLDRMIKERMEDLRRKAMLN